MHEFHVKPQFQYHDVDVTKHALDRLKSRLGLGKKAAKRHAKLAFYEGVPPKDYGMKEIASYYANRQELDRSNMILIYKHIVHVFGINDMKLPVLITAYDPLVNDEKDPIYIKGRLAR